MGGSIIVMEPRDYEAWLAGADTTALAGEGMSPEELFTAKACDTCHRPDSDLQGPYLAGLFGSEVRLVSGETVVADEAYVRQSILDPASQVVEGYTPLMPTYAGQLSEEEILQLIQYIKGLEGDGHGASPTPDPATPSQEEASP